MNDNVGGLFLRGKTFYGPNQTIDTSDYGTSVGLEGKTSSFTNRDSSDTGMGAKNKVTAGTNVCRIVRNVSGINLLPKRAVTWAAGYRNQRVDGYVNLTTEEIAGIVDEHLPSTGVRNGDLFWITQKGPSLVLSDLAGGAANVIAEGGIVYALTAATSGATTAGRIQGFPVAGTFTATQTTDGTSYAVLANGIGRAMSAKTTANTNADVLVDLEILK